MTDVVMPQMGESIAEGTIVRWIKKVGDKVERDEPLFEISTDKVDAEIPSPVAGVLTEIRAQGRRDGSGQQRRRGDRAGRREGRRRLACRPRPRRPPPPPPSSRRDGSSAPISARRRRRQRQQPKAAAGRDSRSRPSSDRRAAGAPSPPRKRCASGRRRSCAGSPRSTTSTSRRFTAPASPGRVTKDDILAFHRARRRVGQLRRSGETARRRGAAASGRRTHSGAGAAEAGVSARRGQSVPMSVMRKKIAEHMVAEPAHVGARALGVRGELLSASRRFARRRRPSTSAPARSSPICRSSSRPSVDALRAVPVVNASVDGDNIVYHKADQRRHRRGARLGPDRAGDQERRREEPARA